MKFATKPSRRETIWGGIYLGLYMTILPWLVPVLTLLISRDLDVAQVNFVFFCLNFAVVTVIFRKYLVQSAKDAMLIPGRTLWYALLGYLGNTLLSSLVVTEILRIYPEFMNVNDSAINSMVMHNRPLMFIGAVILAPITEELLFRGLIFRGLYDRSSLIAHLLTMALFSLIHVTGYVGMYEWKMLFFCFIQYLPAAYCLNFAYQQSGTILSPILMHMLSNLVAFSAMR